MLEIEIKEENVGNNQVKRSLGIEIERIEDTLGAIVADEEE